MYEIDSKVNEITRNIFMFFEILNYNTHRNTFKNAIYSENDIQLTPAIKK